MMRTSRGKRWLLAVLCVVMATMTLTAGAPAQTDGEGDGRPKRGWLRRFRPRPPDKYERNHSSVLAAFGDVVQDTKHSTVRVLSDGIQTAMGAIVRSDGYVLTKASELQGELVCYFGNGARLEADVIAVHDESDLALLRVDAENLPTIRWQEDGEIPIGSWLATTNVEETAASIGIVSAPPRSIPKPRPVLGIRLEESGRGPLVESVIPRSAAAKAGLKSGDVITSIDDQKLADRGQLIEEIGRRTPGDRVRLAVLRDGKPKSITAMLGDFSHVGNQQQADLMDSLGGPLSKRRYGFPSVLQHDSVLRPRDCGGPIVGLDGRVVGINIARASRVASYALPASYVKPVLDDLFKNESMEATDEEALKQITVDKAQGTND